MTKSVLSGAAALILGTTALASAPQYHATMLPRLDSNNIRTRPRAMNDAGVVTGELGSGLGFIWSPETGPIFLQSMNSDIAAVGGSAINNAGDVVGGYQPVGTFDNVPFLRTADGMFGPLPMMSGSAFTGVSGINDSGMVIGTASLPSSGGGPGGERGGSGTTSVYWQDGQIFDIGGLGGPDSRARGVNNNGVVVGASNVEPFMPQRPYRWSASGGFVELETPTVTSSSQALDINDNNLVVGRGFLDFFTPKAVYWTPDGELNIMDGLAPEGEDVLDLGALAVNNSGVIVGTELYIPGGGKGGKDGRGDGKGGKGGEGERPTEPNALVWLDNQPFDLMDLTVNLADLPGDIHFRGGVDVNASGQILIEASIYRDGQLELVTIVLTSVPAPGGATLLGIAGFAMTRRRR